MAAAVVWPEESTWSDEIKSISATIKDSKQLSSKKRKVIEEQIKTHSISWSVGRVDANEIDTIGMTKSNRLAFERAIHGLSVPIQRVLIDGILGITTNDSIEQIVTPKGDGIYLSIAAASILAKEGHDRFVDEYCSTYTDLNDKYSILNSKGYGTIKHRNGIKSHGIHELHRRLFLRKLLGLNHIISEEYEFIED
jgi:ribonuclease HII